ncbi:RHS repeat-associated core domain-containing protein, partial [Sulfurimonas sp.]|uniref:RHS repeat-associated core domain-containing protein n=1 Tax=Sulfurimonas sp. TaxID=2022749 RepID=UPI002AB0628D
KKEYRCIKVDDEDTKRCRNIPVGSFVSPTSGIFHEDIELIGSEINLHYQSEYLNNKTIAHGWSLNLHHTLDADYIYLGSGTSLNIKDYKSQENNSTIVTLGDKSYIFDSNNNHTLTKDNYTDKTLYSFAYNSNNSLTSISDAFSNTTTINRDANNIVTSITTPHGQINSISIDANKDLINVTYEDSSNYKFVYENHLMLSEIEPNGNEFIHEFDDNGKVIKVTDAQQGIWSFSNSTNDTYNETIVNKASGDTTTYRDYFLADGSMVSKTIIASGDIFNTSSSIDGTSSTSDRCGVSTTLNYQTDKDPVTQKRVPSSITTQMPSGLSKTTNYSQTYIFDINNSLVKKESSVESNGAITTSIRDYNLSNETITSAQSRVSTISYNPETLLPTKVEIANLEPIVYIYDEQGRILNTQQGTRTISYTYDNRGNLSSVTDASNRVTNYSYDLKNRLVSITYPDNHTLNYSYDSNGNITTLTTPTPTEHTFGYNGVNKRTSMASPLNATTTYSYDKQKRITNVNRPSGANIDYTYLNGRLSSIQTLKGTTNYNYACQNNPSSISRADESFNFSYDGELLTQMIQAGVLNTTLSYTYNNNFLPSSITYAGTTTNYLYNKDNELTTSGDFGISRDYENSKITTSDNNYSLTTKFNGYGELKSQEDNTFKIELVRNSNAQIIKKIETFKNNKSIEHSYVYDERGRLTSTGTIASVTYEDAQDIDTLGWRVYDDDPVDASISNVYDDDKQSRVIKLEGEATSNGYLFGGWSNTTEKSIKWSMNYNESFVIYIGAQTTKGHRYIYYSNTNTDKGMHANGTYIHHGLGTDSSNGSWQTFTRDLEADLKEYESDNELLSVETFLIRGSGLVDDIGLLSNGYSENETYSYNANGNRLEATVNGVTTTASYTLDDNLEVYDNNTYRYNEDGYLIEKITPNSGTTSYTYNTLGALTGVNITKAQSDKWHLYDSTPVGASISTIYDEDKQSHVIEFNGARTSNGYRMGYTGNTNPNSWNNTTDKTLQWSMKYSDSFVIYISIQTTKGHRYIYYTASDTDKGMHENGTYIHHGLGADAYNGSWKTFTRNLEADLKEYDGDNELISVNGFLIRGNGRVDDISTISPDSQITVYEDAQQEKETKIIYYQNALNQRVAKEVNNEIVEKYLWANLTTLLAIYNKDNNLTQRFNYTNNRMPTSMTMNNQTYYLHYDQVGTLKLITDKNHNIIKEITYDTFGNILQDTNKEFKILFGFAGGLHDRDTNLVHFGYREYDPQTGKWTAKDPIDFEGGDANLYGYVLGDPVGFVDPEGLSGLIFNRENKTLTIYNSEGEKIISFPAQNNTTSKTRPWKDGTYKYSHYKAHTESKKTGPYGSNGNFVFTVKGRSGMGVHSGRKGPASKTLGCIRTTNKATKYLLELHKTDALTSIKVK